MSENVKSAACQLQSLIAIMTLIHFPNSWACTQAHMCINMYIWTQIHMASKPIVAEASDVCIYEMEMKWKN